MSTPSSRYVKMTAIEGTFSAAQNIVSFSIPEGMKISLADSHVLVNVSVTTTDTNARALPRFDGVKGLYKNSILFNDAGISDAVLPSVCFVRNADIRTSRMGQVESLRSINTLRLAQYIYEDDIETKFGDQYTGIGNSDTILGLNASPLLACQRSGSISSEYKPATLRIPMAHIFDVGNAEVWDTSKYGRTDVKLEMEFSKMVVQQTMGQADTNWTNAFGGNATCQAIDAPNAGGAFAGATTVTDFVPTRTYTHPEEHMPFYVGQKLLIQYRRVNGGVTTEFNIAGGNFLERTISAISYNQNDDTKLSLSFVDGIAFAAGDVISNMIFIGVNQATATIVFNKVELEMKQVKDPTPARIEYTTYSTEEDSGFGAAQTNINNQYTCDGDTDTLYICAMGVNGGAQRVMPNIKPLSHRLTIDNEEETSEAVVSAVTGGVGQAKPLYYDRQDRGYLNMGDDIECFNENFLGFNESLEDNPSNQGGSAIVNPLPLKASPKQVQVNLDYAAGTIRKLGLYKRSIRSI